MSTSEITTGSAGSADALPDYAPVPRSALGPALNEQGYYVGRVERNLYWVTDGTYQSAFLTTPDGVVLFDAPTTIGHNIRRAVDEVAAANGVTNKVSHLIYSHHHADHGGASSLFDKNVTRMEHEETRRLLLRDDDPARPPNEETFQDRRTLEIGGERIDLAWHGPNHSPDNIVIHLPDHDTLMLIDIVNPGWAPIYLSNLTEDIPGYVEAPANALTYPWKHFIGGHNGPPRHPRRRDAPSAVHGGHRRQLQESDRHGRSDSLLPEVRRERVGGREGLPRRSHRHCSRARDRDVHRRARGRGRVHGEHDLLGDGVDPARPRLRLTGAPLMALPARPVDLRDLRRLLGNVGRSGRQPDGRR
jgi:glyoxylase-like metal-dependent hydrolase (beta-lactamase superfamily II)